MTHAITLNDLTLGQKAQITGFEEGDLAYQHKLQALGLTPGTPITLLQIAPLGDPILLEARGVRLCVRKDEAQCLLLERLST